MIRVEGKGGIYAEVVADSINIWGDRVTTYHLHYHRYIHSEFMTHRRFSRNASSSRAIPVKSMLAYIEDNTATPIHWGKNQAGMQADGENDAMVKSLRSGQVSKEDAWNCAMKHATFYSAAFDKAGYHKQIVNRLTEPFQYMNVVCSATDYDNFFYLRIHPDAQPEIVELARCMYEAREQSDPELLMAGEWHTPYVDHDRSPDGVLSYVSEGNEINLEEAQKISTSCSAQVSYRNNDTSLEKALTMYDRLVGMKPLHSSPFEHVLQPFDTPEYQVRLNASADIYYVLKGIYTEKVAEAMAAQSLYSGNVRGWTQIRKTLDGEDITDYEAEKS